MRTRSLALVFCVVSLHGCFFDCLGLDDGGGTGGGGGSTDTPGVSLNYNLVEAQGEWAVVGSATGLNCRYDTTVSKLTFSLAAPDTNAAQFESRGGTFVAFVTVNATQSARTGTQTCGSNAPSACPSSNEMSQTFPGFLSIQAVAPLPMNAPDGAAFVPAFSNINLPRLCNNNQYETSPVYLRGKPVTVAELKSGRFVLEAQGTTPITTPEPQPGEAEADPVTGTLSYSFRLVFQTSDYDASKAVAPTSFTSFDECLVDVPSTDVEIEAAEASFAAGADDIALNATGCRRLKVTRNGSTTTLSHELTLGTQLVYDASTGVSHGARNAVTTYVREVSPTAVHEKSDPDRDGFFESVVDSTLDANGQWLSTVGTLFAPKTSTVLRKATRTRVDDTTMRVQLEENGVLVDDFVTAIAQKGCFTPTSKQDPACAPAGGGTPPTCGGGVAPCSAAQKKNVLKQLNAAVKKGTRCLDRVGFKDFDTEGKALTLIGSGSLNFVCSTNPCDPYGEFTTRPGPDGKHQFMVNVVRNNATELSKTLFHEMLHSDPRFSHDDNLVDAASNACKLQMADRTYACETMCFNPRAGGSCACVRCLSPSLDAPSQDVCDKCSAYGACPQRTEPDGKGGTQLVASEVGAYCKRLKTFCDTKAECDTECATIQNACQPIKASCRQNCN